MWYFKTFQDYLRYVAYYSLLDPNVAFIYEKDNPYKHFPLVSLYILMFFLPSLLILAFSNNVCADRGLSKIINMWRKDNLCT